MEITKDTHQNMNGITLLRFTHAFESGGGVENYLKDCNRILLQRNNMTIVQVFYSYSNELAALRESELLIGKGKLINIAIPRCKKEESGTKNTDFSISRVLKPLVRNSIFNNSIFQRYFRIAQQRHLRRPSGFSVSDTYRIFSDIFSNYQIDLVSLHCLGTYDTSEIIDLATSRNIPFFYLNHFSNKKLNNLGIQKQLPWISGIAGISDCEVPKIVRPQFVSLYDGVDTSFFSIENASPVPLQACKDPIIFLPARICEGKGHADIIKAAYLLRKEHSPVHVIFAGRTDSPKFKLQLQTMIDQNRMSDCVTFYDHCSIEEIRNMYALSSIVVLPSKSEGLGRVLLEAQAMSVPVVAYDVGGTSQSLQHGKSGYLCNYGDIHDLKNCLKRIISDSTLRDSLGKNGRNFVLQNFTLEHLARRHEVYYQSILSQRTSSQR